MKEVKELLKLAADSMKNETLCHLLESDMEYQKRSELTEKQRYIVDTLIARKDEVEYDYHVNAYMAGMLDGYEILKMFNLTRE